MNNIEAMNEYNNKVSRLSKEIFADQSEKFTASSFDLGCFDVNREAAKQANEMMKPLYLSLFDDTAELSNQVQIMSLQLDILKKKLRKLVK